MAANAYVRPGLGLAAPPLPHANADLSPPQQAGAAGKILPRRTAPATK